MIEITLYSENLVNDWDAFCAISINATFLHTRKFLNYHGAKFADRSLVLRVDGEIVALFVAAEDPGCKEKIVSHPGISYGGLVVTEKFIGDKFVEAVEQICGFYKKKGYKELIYKQVPRIYHKKIVDDEIYSIFRNHGQLIRVDLSSTIPLCDEIVISSRRKRSLKKANQSSIEIKHGNYWLKDLWPVLEENLIVKHNVKPVHTSDEIQFLAALFPENINTTIACLNGEVLGGVVLFNVNSVSHAQYICSSDLGKECGALDLVFENVISRAKENGYQYFDFGISTENSGRKLNTGLYKFKSEFGARGVSHLFFKFALN